MCLRDFISLEIIHNNFTFYNSLYLRVRTIVKLGDKNRLPINASISCFIRVSAICERVITCPGPTCFYETLLQFHDGSQSERAKADVTLAVASPHKVGIADNDHRSKA